MTENQIATIIVDASLKIHRALGPGLLESVYEATLAFELRRRGLIALREQERASRKGAKTRREVQAAW